MTKWEYCKITHQNEFSGEIDKVHVAPAVINVLGQQGWELAAAVVSGVGGMIDMWFKRPIEPISALKPLEDGWRLTADRWPPWDADTTGCGTGLGEDEIVMDHIVALAHGGAHIASNVAPSCQPCNSRKHAQDWGYPHPGIPREGARPETGSKWL